MSITVIAMYESADKAEKVVNEIVRIGFGRDNVNLLRSEGQAEKVLIGKLASRGIKQDEAQLMAKAIGRGSALVAVDAPDEKAEDALALMDRYGARDLDQLAAEYGGQGQIRGEQSQSVPVIEEQVSIGTRQVLRGGVRVTSKVVERPIEETVRLREENVEVERKQADRRLSAAEADKAFEEKTIELTETGEEAIVNKEARVVGEVNLRKTAEEREEQVRATARRTEVEVSDIEPQKRSENQR